MLCAVLAAALACASLGAQAQGCAIVPLSAVSGALPQYAPWVLESGGAGACQFAGQWREGGSIETVNLHLMQQFAASPKEAAALMKTVRTEYSKSGYAATPLQLPGAEPGAFFYQLDAPRGLGWYAQTGRGVLSGMFIAPASQGQEAARDQAAVRTVLQGALTATAAPAAATQASQCAHFNDALVRKLLTGKTIKVQQFGEDSCMATNERNAVVLFTRQRGLDAQSQAQSLQSRGEADCQNTPQPDLGPHGLLMHGCKQGNPRASVSFTQGDALYEYSVVPGSAEPTAQQRADLLALARWRIGR